MRSLNGLVVVLVSFSLFACSEARKNAAPQTGGGSNSSTAGAKTPAKGTDNAPAAPEAEKKDGEKAPADGAKPGDAAKAPEGAQPADGAKTPDAGKPADADKTPATPAAQAGQTPAAGSPAAPGNPLGTQPSGSGAAGGAPSAPTQASKPPVSGPGCVVVRAAFDVGSASTKVKVAQVDACLQKISKILFSAETKVDYKTAITQKASNGQLSQAIVTSGIQALKGLKAQAAKFKPVEYSGVATAAFRLAKNGEPAAKRIETETGIKLRILSQKDEGQLGFYAGSTAAPSWARSVIVWDIGGGSQQITARSEDLKSFDVYEGKTASIGFKDEVIRTIQKKDTKKVSTPNPMALKDLRPAVDLAGKAALDVSKDVRGAILSTGSAVVGIGGVFGKSVMKRLGLKAGGKFTMLDLAQAIRRDYTKNDKQLGGGPYASTEVTNLLLILGYMRELGILYVFPADINLADGLLVLPGAWTKPAIASR